MDIVIFYELEKRELDNACLIKSELETRGYSVELLEIFKPAIPFIEKPKLVITHSLYEEYIPVFTSYFFSKVDKILNLQYEQVLTKKWLDCGYHAPSGKVKDVIQLCWGKNNVEWLKSLGIDEKNLLLVGDIKTDFARPEFRSFFKSKEELAKEYNMDSKKEWVLFISSFTLVTADSFFLELNNNRMTDTYVFKEIMIKSKIHVMNWIKRFLAENPDKEFIYRQHPVEATQKDFELENLSKEYDSFHLVSEYSVQQWITCSDFINTWISTSIIDAYVLNKHCNILRPVPVDNDFDNPLFIDATHITSYEEFNKRNNSIKNQRFPIPKEEIEEYYNFGDKPSYELICDYIEKIIDDDSYKKEYYDDFSNYHYPNLNLENTINYINESKMNEMKNFYTKYTNIQERIHKIISDKPFIAPELSPEFKILDSIYKSKKNYSNKEIHYLNLLNKKDNIINKNKRKLKHQKRLTNSITNSHSWKVTKPLRYIINKLKKIKK